MKKLSSIAIITLLLVSCGGNKVKNNEFLGKFPDLNKQYNQEIEDKKKQTKESTDVEKIIKLNKEIMLLGEEAKAKITKCLEENPLKGKELPFEAITDIPYTIHKVEVNSAAYNHLNIKFSLKINEDIKSKYGSFQKRLFVYYKALDKDGNEIPDSKTVATKFGSRTELKAGLEYEVYGTWTANVEMFGSFAKIQQISKEEYDQK